MAHIITDNGSNIVKCGGVGLEEALLVKYEEDDVALEGMDVCAIRDHMQEESDKMPRHNWLRLTSKSGSQVCLCPQVQEYLQVFIER